MHSLRVLIVEDEPLIALDLQDIFEDAGHTVVGTAATMRDALLRASTSTPFDLAVLDVDLAGSDDGIMTANRLRDEFGIEALFVSGRADAEVRARRLNWKPLGFISKPYLPRQVLQAVRQVSCYR